MLRRCAMLPVQLLLALVSHSVSAQDPDGSVVNIRTLDVNLMKPDAAAEASSDFIRVASSVTSSSVVDMHNYLRAEVLASNMEYVDQNGVLTGDINAWLSQCDFNDAMVVQWDSATFPYVNGFKAISSADDITGIINFISRMPTSSSLYKMLMKSDNRYLGCGSVRCPLPLPLPEYTLVACLYASRSDLDLYEEPYQSGEPCTECSSGIYWCDDNLCREDCYQSSAHCECRVDCGGFSSVTLNCSCLCPNGYEGNKCQPLQDTTTDSEEDWSSDWTEGGTTLVVSVTLILIALLTGSLCLVLYHKKYRLSKLRPEVSLESESSARRTNIYVTSSSPSSFDPSKYPSPPPAYSPISPNTGLDPPPYGYTASPTDAAEEVGNGESPPPYQQINVLEQLTQQDVTNEAHCRL